MYSLIATRVRNRWLVAYTLIKNPSIQQYTANNIELLKKDKERAQVFSLEHTIKKQSEIESYESDEKAGGLEKLFYGEEQGVEIKLAEKKVDQKEALSMVVNLGAELGEEPKERKGEYQRFT